MVELLRQIVSLVYVLIMDILSFMGYWVVLPIVIWIVVVILDYVLAHENLHGKKVNRRKNRW